MPQFERRLYDPAEDSGALDDDAMNEEEGSRLPLLIVIALVVLASFAGVVWLAYTQGVQRGREDAPRIIASQQDRLAEQKNPYSDLNIYKRTKPGAAEKPTVSAPPQPAPDEMQPAAPSAPASKPAPTAILPPPIPNPNAEAPVKPAATPQTNAVKPPAASITPKPGAAPIGNPSTSVPPASAIQPSAHQANGAPRAITPNAIANAPASAMTNTTIAPPAAKPAPQQPAPNTQTAAANPAVVPPGNAAAQSFVLQIGSYTSEAEARASWETYKAGHPSVAGYAPDVQTADLGRRGTWYRLRVGPFATMQDAAAACAKLRAQGASCLPTKR